MRETSGPALPRHDSISASKELVRVSGPARQLERRLFLKQGLSLGALTLLTGCDVTDATGVQRACRGLAQARGAAGDQRATSVDPHGRSL